MPISAASEIFLLPLSSSQSLADERGSQTDARRPTQQTALSGKTSPGHSKTWRRTPPQPAQSADNLLENSFLGDEANAVLKVFADLTQLENFSGPIVLYGPPQTGKTFLAKGLVQRLARFRSYRKLLATKNPLDGRPAEDRTVVNEADSSGSASSSHEKAICISAGDFGVQLQDAIDTNSLTEFRNRFLRAGAVHFDDAQLLNHSPFTQSQLVILLDLLEQCDVPVVITLSKLPTQLTDLRNDLVSRLMGGLVLPIDLPGPQAKLMALVHYASQAGVKFSAEAADWIVEEAPLATFSALKGFVNELTLRSFSIGIPGGNEFNLGSVIACFAEIHNFPAQQLPDLIIDTVAAFFELSSEQLKGPCRRQTTVLARGLALTIIRSFCPLSLTGLGSLFGNRDHSTVLNALHTTDEKLKKDSTLRASLAQIMSQLKRLAGQLNIPLTAIQPTADKTIFQEESPGNC